MLDDLPTGKIVTFAGIGIAVLVGFFTLKAVALSLP